eukprot:11126894-Lingulodinium_polyedra.AAC.1
MLLLARCEAWRGLVHKAAPRGVGLCAQPRPAHGEPLLLDREDVADVALPAVVKDQGLRAA